MEVEHTVLLFHTDVRRLSCGKVLNRLFELPSELLAFLKNSEKRPVYAHHLESHQFLFRLAFLADIFAALNDFCISLQGRGTDIISSVEKITAFKWKLHEWLKLVPKGSFNQFLKFSELRESIQVDKHVLSDIEDPLLLLRSKLDYIFPFETIAPS